MAVLGGGRRGSCRRPGRLRCSGTMGWANGRGGQGSGRQPPVLCLALIRPSNFTPDKRLCLCIPPAFSPPSLSRTTQHARCSIDTTTSSSPSPSPSTSTPIHLSNSPAFSPTSPLFRGFCTNPLLAALLFSLPFFFLGTAADYPLTATTTVRLPS
jgi:hypothetical protein